MRFILSAAASALCLQLASTMAGAAELNLICSADVVWCEQMAGMFEKERGIKVNMVRLSSGETYAKVRAESRNPKTDIWWAGTGDPHLQAANEGLTQEYTSPRMAELQDWSKKQAASAKNRTVGVYAGALGWGYNTDLIAKKGLKEPKCWSDLLDPSFKGEIQMANPNSSGTAYTVLATLVQLMGEDQAFDYLRRLHPNINSYARSGTGPIKAVARGETGVSLSFVHDAVTERNAGFPVSYATPCEGTGYEIGSMSILRGARNIAQARRFYDWALTAEAQAIGAEAKAYQLPSNRNAAIPPQAPRFENIRLIDYDFARWGNAEERTRLITRWEREVRAGAR
jgi:iron(III) transport system substrate-binding protein